MNQVNNPHHNFFEAIKQQTQEGKEYWSARDLQPILEYAQWRNFEEVIKKAVKACQNAGHNVQDHFADVSKMVKLGSGAERELPDYHLSRYACYLVVQNGDPSKTVIANGQTYFAMQTRRQELEDDGTFGNLSEDEKRMYLRNELKHHNTQLAATAKKSGVETNLDFAIFQDHGYRGLYGGMGAKDLHQKRDLKKSQKILDHMGSTELAANLFRATQAEEKLRRDSINGKDKANSTHFAVGQKVRQTISEIGGDMPEDMPPATKSTQSIERAQNKQKKLKKK